VSNNKKDFLNLIRKLLLKNPDGYTVSEIARILKCSRNTVRLYMEKLDRGDKIKIRKVGVARIYKYRG
jgi:Mn-dependent DtxR family transcriptional regulator